MFVHSLVNTIFIELYKHYRAPWDHRLKKSRRKEEKYIFQNQKTRVKNNMLCEL